MSISSVLDQAHVYVRRASAPGDTVVDATVGNGHDTLALAEAVEPGGEVYGFDVQEEALTRAQARIQSASPEADVTFFQKGHESMLQSLPRSAHGSVAAVTFNLGYLPGSSSGLTTTPETTLPALEAATEVLRPGGIMAVVVYTGHEGGAEEARAVEDWTAELSQEQFHALSYRFVNQVNDPPRLLAIEKRTPTSAA